MSPKTIRILGLVLLLGALLRVPYLFHTLQDMDEGCYAGAAAVLMDGGLPYRDAVENKPPGIFYLYRAVFELFGRYNMGAVHALTFAWTLLTAAVLALAARQLGGRLEAVCTFLFYLVFTASLYPKMIAANSEIFMALPCALGALALLDAFARNSRALYFAAGLAFGFAPLFKQVGAVGAAAVFAFLLILPLSRRGMRVGRTAAPLLLFAAGFVLPAAAVAFLFHRAGILGDWLFWNVTYPVRYVGSGNAALPFFPQLLGEFLPFVLATVLLWALAALWVRHEAGRWRSGGGFSLFILLWLASSTGATFIGSRMFGHYFIQILPPLCLAAGLSAGRLLSAGDPLRRRAWKGAVVALTLVPGVIFALMGIAFEASTNSWWRPEPDFRPATDYIRRHTAPGDTIFVWGWFTPVYVYAERTPATRFMNTHLLTGYREGNDPDERDRADIAWHAVPEAWPMLEADLRRNRPVLVVDTSPGDYHDFGRYPIRDYAPLARYLDDACRLEKRVAGMDIYRCR